MTVGKWPCAPPFDCAQGRLQPSFWLDERPELHGRTLKLEMCEINLSHPTKISSGGKQHLYIPEPSELGHAVV